MPHSLVINLVPETPIPPGFTAGKSLHALFLTLVSHFDKDLGDRLHANQANKAFTLSPLQLLQRPERPAAPSLRWRYRKPISAGTHCWWRISLLDDRLFRHLTPLWLGFNPDRPWHLGPANLHITSILGTPQSTQPWANFCNYANLYDRAAASQRKLALQFHTPTAFRQGTYDSALPSPERVFGSLLRRWNHYSDRQFSSEILTVLRPSSFEIRTEVAVDPRHQFQATGAKINPCNHFVGCVGRVTYEILGAPDPEVCQQLNTLADFALYAGVGRKTPMGMGIATRIDTNSDRP